MASIKELHYSFKLGADRIDSLSSEDFSLAEIDWLINEAQMVFLKRRVGPNNFYKRGFENSQKRIDDLSTLVIKYPVQPAITPTLVEDIYEVNLSDLLYTYFRFISGKVIATIATNCVKNIPLRHMSHDDYLLALRDPFNSPSTEFIPFNFGKSSASDTTSIYLYPGDYTIDEVHVEYIKYPSKVSYGNYIYIDGNTYPEATLEFPEHTHQEIIDVALEIAALNIENPEYVQLKTRKVFSNE